MLSGVNRGQNVAEDVTYSGTVAGAMEATLLGIPAIALSQAYGAASAQRAPLGLRGGACARHHPQGAGRRAFPPQVLVNINFPDCEPEEVQGVAVRCRAGARRTCSRIEERVDGRGNPYFWIAFARGAVHAGQRHRPRGARREARSP